MQNVPETITVRLPTRVVEALRVSARADDRPLSMYVRRVLVRHVEQHDRPVERVESA